MKRENCWKGYDEKQLEELEKINSKYREMLDAGKTERECVDLTVDLAKKVGYKDLKDIIKDNGSLKTGDKVYAVCMNKAIVLYQIGEEDIENGMNILGAHIDSPRIDVKQNPLYEDSELAFLDTHYYGGIKKYQWVAMPLALHGVIIKKDGTKVTINIGEKDEDPVFVITDLLAHLSREQMDKTARLVVEGENLDLLIANKPLKSEEKDAVKANVLKLLKDTYNIEEEDFLSAELEIVPAGKARECGIDKSMIMAYGQDDRVCAFTSLMAMLEDKPVKRTTCCILVDKEEIGSVGATGMQGRFFENSLAELMDRMGQYSSLKLRRTLENSKMLSSDVSAAYDPLYGSAYEKKNSAYFAKGLVFNKFTGSGGKGGSNDANPEYIAHLRNIMEKNNVTFQTAELGKVDLGGGGTIAYILANYGMQVIDSGVAVLCMHAPWEITSKADIYEAFKGYRVFLDEA
ncbi:aminopeptidase [uncultured Tyzzerella sp.]|uniref:aminopeptidase n=1 Tax=uncultured Tyzzerella sp. TaxID=2321398 RepID=UPI0029421D9E|nr:aminopeptidase [uncultured Tyzzerella sp.]